MQRNPARLRTTAKNLKSFMMHKLKTQASRAKVMAVIESQGMAAGGLERYFFRQRPESCWASG